MHLTNTCVALDYWKKETGKDYAPQDDPGVISVAEIYNYYKKYDYKTIGTLLYRHLQVFSLSNWLDSDGGVIQKQG